MSVSISDAAAGVGMPQVRSRSVSLRIGPFGLTYATDQVLWRTGGAQSLPGAQQSDPAGPVRASEAAGDATQAAPPEVAVQAASAARTQAQQPSRAFSQELNDARVQAELWRQAGQTQPASGAETRDAGGEGQSALADSGGQSATQGRGGSALKRAISAYLSCAANLSRPAPMLQATA